MVFHGCLQRILEPLKSVGWFLELGECICKQINGFLVLVEGVYIAWTFIRIDLEVINDGVYALTCALTILFVVTDEQRLTCMLFWLGFNSRFGCIIIWRKTCHQKISSCKHAMKYQSDSHNFFDHFIDLFV
jgi:hypothetical protein